MPIPIARNKNAKSSGSFTGVLNLITDNAPTNPKDKANEDFTINITKKVILLNKGMIGAIWVLEDKEFDLCLYTYINRNDESRQKINDIKIKI